MNYLNEKGNALVLTIFTLVLVSVIGFSLLTVTANSHKTTVNERSDQSIYYIAEAGLNFEKSMLYSKIKPALSATVYEFNTTKPEDKIHFNFTSTFDSYFCKDNPDYCNVKEKQHTSFQQQFTKNPVSETVVLKKCTATDEMDCTFIIKSKGFFHEQPSKTRNLEQTIKVSLKTENNEGNTEGNTENGQSPNEWTQLPFPNVVAVVDGKITNGGFASEIHGNLASNSNDYDVKQKNFVGDAKTLDVKTPINIQQYLPPFVSADFQKLNLPSTLSSIQSSDIKLDELKGVKGGLIIDVGSSNRTIYVNTLELDDKEYIEVRGSGTLNIIVNEKIDLDGIIKRTDNNPQKLNIYYQGSKDLDTNNDTFIGGSLNILKSEVDFKGGEIMGNIYYHGNILLEVHVNGYNYANYLVAPYAKVQTHGNAKFTGVILAKELEINGNHELYPSDKMLVPLPNPTPPPIPTPIPSISIVDKPPFSESDVEEK